jgi:hypothetical protein
MGNNLLLALTSVVLLAGCVEIPVETTTTTSTLDLPTATTSTTAYTTTLPTSTSTSSSSTTIVSTSTTTTTTTTVATITTTTLLVNAGTPTTYYGYKFYLENIISTGKSDQYEFEIRTPDGAVKKEVIYDRGVIDGLEFGILERLDSLKVRIYVKRYKNAYLAPKVSDIFTIGGKDYRSFEREFCGYKFRLNSPRSDEAELWIQKPDGDEVYRKLSRDRAVEVGSIKIGLLELSTYPGGYVMVYAQPVIAYEELELEDFRYAGISKTDLLSREMKMACRNVHVTMDMSVDETSDLKNIAHTMESRIIWQFWKPQVNISGLGYSDVVYLLNTGFIPMQDIYVEGSEHPVDLEYRGKLFFGDRMFYVVDIVDETLYLAQIYGGVLNTQDCPFDSDEWCAYGYQFKLDDVIYEGEMPHAVKLYVKKPEGKVTYHFVTGEKVTRLDTFNGVRVVSLREIDGEMTCNLIVYDLNLLMVRNNEAFGGNPDLRVKFGIVEQPFDNSMDISEYGDIKAGQKLLENISIVDIG